MSTQTVTQRRTGAASSGSAPRVVTRGGVVVNRVPTAKPSFTVKDLRSAIPARCFERPLLKSVSYLFWDLVLVSIIYYASTLIPLITEAQFGASVAPVLRHAAWLCYWICQGCVLTGIWVIGHECGHRGFHSSDLVNDIFGIVTHSFLLVPYFSWQISHRRHHSNTGSVEHDEVFIPRFATQEEIEKVRSKRASGNNVLTDEDGFLTTLGSTVTRIFWMVVMLTLGWPGYLWANMSGNSSYDPKAWVNHFMPTSPIFNTGDDKNNNNQKLIVISDVALIAVVCLFYKWVQQTSLAHFIYVYFIPYLIVNFWLVLITYLQHTDVDLPHYTDGEWDWLRGALATVDRDYGILNYVFHNITDTHVAHHLFSTMPHYHAMEATHAIKKVLGPYYRADSTPIATALWNSFRDCDAIYPDETQKGVYWFEPM